MDNIKDLTDETLFNTTELAFERLYEITKKLRSESGCPWDREQTPLSMRPSLIEEVFEAEDAITQQDPNHAKEELGDVLFNTILVSYMYEQNKNFSIHDMLTDICNKIVRRHPHVWKNSEGKANAISTGVKSTSDVLFQWDAIKQGIEGRKEKCELDEIAKGLPPLLRAYKIQKKASKKGFDWDDIACVWDKVSEEMKELKDACSENKQEHISEEVGDLLFAVINLARHLNVDPVLALTNTNRKFRNRYNYVEQQMEKNGIPMEKGKLSEMDRYWEQAKEKGL